MTYEFTGQQVVVAMKSVRQSLLVVILKGGYETL